MKLPPALALAMIAAPVAAQPSYTRLSEDNFIREMSPDCVAKIENRVVEECDRVMVTRIGHGFYLLLDPMIDDPLAQMNAARHQLTLEEVPGAHGYFALSSVTVGNTSFEAEGTCLWTIDRLTCSATLDTGERFTIGPRA